MDKIARQKTETTKTPSFNHLNHWNIEREFEKMMAYRQRNQKDKFIVPPCREIPYPFEQTSQYKMTTLLTMRLRALNDVSHQWRNTLAIMRNLHSANRTYFASDIRDVKKKLFTSHSMGDLEQFSEHCYEEIRKLEREQHKNSMQVSWNEMEMSEVLREHIRTVLGEISSVKMDLLQEVEVEIAISERLEWDKKAIKELEQKEREGKSWISKYIPFIS